MCASGRGNVGRSHLTEAALTRPPISCATRKTCASSDARRDGRAAARERPRPAAGTARRGRRPRSATRLDGRRVEQDAAGGGEGDRRGRSPGRRVGVRARPACAFQVQRDEALLEGARSCGWDRSTPARAPTRSGRRRGRRTRQARWLTPSLLGVSAEAPISSFAASHEHVDGRPAGRRLRSAGVCRTIGGGGPGRVVSSAGACHPSSDDAFRGRAGRSGRAPTLPRCRLIYVSAASSERDGPATTASGHAGGLTYRRRGVQSTAGVHMTGWSQVLRNGSAPGWAPSPDADAQALARRAASASAIAA
jgi:hypothetical protein